MTAPPGTRSRSEVGSITPLVLGFFVIVALLVAVVVDASAAYLRREGLDALADAVALAATEGLQGDGLYRDGVARIDPEAAQRYAADYLLRTGAGRRFPGLDWRVATSGRTITVRLTAPLTLPLRVPGSLERVQLSGSASAEVMLGP